MKVKITYLNYQRNGVHGDPFYHCLFEMTEGKEKRTMLATFKTGVNDTQILWSSCRAVDVNNPSLPFREGDIPVIASAINDELDMQMMKHGGKIYDCCTKQDSCTV